MALPPPGPPGPYGPPGGPTLAPTAEERNWGMICHLSALLGFVLVPSANIFAPLVVWLIKKNDSAFVDEQGKESVNFHLSLWIYSLAALMMWFTIILIPLACIVWAVVYISGLICTIQGAVAASNGRHYRYPLTLRLIS